MSAASSGNQYSLLINIDDSKLKNALENLSKIGTQIGTNAGKEIEKVKEDIIPTNMISPIMAKMRKDALRANERFTQVHGMGGAPFQENKESLKERIQGRLNQVKENEGITKIQEHLQQIDNSTVGMLAKITSIAGATLAIIESSEYLQEMLKLLQTGIMLIFRPIGDFIGAILKPIMMYFMAKFLVPFIKDVLPLAHKYGTKVGDGLVKLLSGDWKGILESIEGVGEFFNALGGGGKVDPNSESLLVKIPNAIRDALKELFKDNMAYADDGTGGNMPKPGWLKKLEEDWEHFAQWVDHGVRQFIADVGVAWDATKKWFGKVWNDISTNVSQAWGAFVSWTSDLVQKISQGVTQAWSSFVKWSGEVVQGIASNVSKAWGAFIKWGNSFVKSLSENITKAWGSFVRWSGSLVKSVSENVNKAWSAFVTWTGNLVKTVSEHMNTAWGKIVGWFQAVAKSAKEHLGTAWTTIVETTNTIAKRIGEGGQAIVKTIQDGLDTLATPLGTVFDNVITAFNNFATRANNVGNSLGDSRNRNGDRPSSPDTGTHGDPNRPSDTRRNPDSPSGSPDTTGGGVEHDGGNSGTNQSPRSNRGNDRTQTYSPSYDELISQGWTPISNSDMRKYPYTKKFFKYHRDPKKPTTSSRWFAMADEYSEWKRSQNQQHASGSSGVFGSGRGSSGGGGSPPTGTISGGSDKNTQYLRQIADGINSLNKKKTEVKVMVGGSSKGSSNQQEETRRGRFGD